MRNYLVFGKYEQAKQTPVHISLFDGLDVVLGAYFFDVDDLEGLIAHRAIARFVRRERFLESRLAFRADDVGYDVRRSQLRMVQAILCMHREGGFSFELLLAAAQVDVDAKFFVSCVSVDVLAAVFSAIEGFQANRAHALLRIKHVGNSLVLFLVGCHLFHGNHNGVAVFARIKHDDMLPEVPHKRFDRAEELRTFLHVASKPRPLEQMKTKLLQVPRQMLRRTVTFAALGTGVRTLVLVKPHVRLKRAMRRRHEIAHPARQIPIARLVAAQEMVLHRNRLNLVALEADCVLALPARHQRLLRTQLFGLLVVRQHELAPGNVGADLLQAQEDGDAGARPRLEENVGRFEDDQSSALVLRNRAVESAAGRFRFVVLDFVEALDLGVGEETAHATRQARYFDLVQVQGAALEGEVLPDVQQKRAGVVKVVLVDRLLGAARVTHVSDVQAPSVYVVQERVFGAEAGTCGLLAGFKRAMVDDLHVATRETRVRYHVGFGFEQVPHRFVLVKEDVPS